MTTMADGLEAQDSSKSAFMEFGQQSHSQQSSPSMAGGHYPLHCLHSGSHAHHQHDNTAYPGSNTYNRSLPYPYVSHPHHSPYLPSYHNNTGGQTRLDGTGKEAASRPSVRPRLAARATFWRGGLRSCAPKASRAAEFGPTVSGAEVVGCSRRAKRRRVIPAPVPVPPPRSSRETRFNARGAILSPPCDPRQLLVEIRQPARLRCCN